MIVKQLIDEDFVNYKKASMLIGFPYCTMKCDKEYGQPVCHNGALAALSNVEIDARALVQRYIDNPITRAVCMQGMEPFDSWSDVLEFITELRQYSDDHVVIYTGYNKDEIADKVAELSRFSNIIIKFGRYIPNQKSHYDSVLGVNLASDNQYAEVIS